MATRRARKLPRITGASRWLLPAPTKENTVVYLVVGLDAGTLAGWHRNVLARDANAATRDARSRAAAEGVDLLVAAVIGPGSSVVAGSRNRKEAPMPRAA
jgi:hypothetical protein